MRWAVLLFLLCGPVGLNATASAKHGPHISEHSLWPDQYCLEAWGGGAIPLSPRGPSSFAVDYVRAVTGGGGLYARWGTWGLGVEGMQAQFGHQHLDHTSLTFAAGAVVLEKLVLFEEGENEGLFLKAGAGWGQGQLDSIYPGAHAWSAPAGLLAIGYRLPLFSHLELNFIASSWSMLSDGTWDPLAIGDLGVQVGIPW